MPLPGEPKGTVEIDLDSVDLKERQVLKEEARGLHWAHRMGTRGANSNLEEIKDAGGHRTQARKEKEIFVSKKSRLAMQPSVPK